MVDPIPTQTDPLRQMLEGMAQRDYRPRTIQAYRAAVLAFYAAHPGTSSALLGPAHAHAWLARRQAQGLSTEQAASALGLLFGRPFPLAARRPPRPRPTRRSDEVARLLQALPQAFASPAPRLAIALLAATGLRLAELMALRVGDLDLPSGKLRVQRGAVRQDRLLAIPDDLREGLAAWTRRRLPSGPLLAGRYGQPVSARTVQRWLAQVSRNAGLTRPLTAADLRRAWVAERASHGLAATHLQRLAGHGRPASTRRLLKRLSPYS